MKIDDEQVVLVDEGKKRRGRAVKSIKNSDTGVVADKVRNTNVRARVKTKTGINDESSSDKKNYDKSKRSRNSDDDNLKRKIIIFLICMLIGFVIYYIIGVISSHNDGFDSLKDATVAISGYDDGSLVKNGTGFIYKKDDYYGYILTSYYTVRDGDVFKVKVAKKEVSAKLLGGDKYLNVAVLTIDKKYVNSIAKFGNSNKVNPGDSVHVIGRPTIKLKKVTVTDGVLSSRGYIDTKIDKENYSVDVFKSTASVSDGDSGAPLCNDKGLVVGIVTSKASSGNTTYAVPLDDIKDSLYIFERGSYIDRPYIGILVFDVSDSALLSKYNISIDNSLIEGVVIADVKGSSKAYKVLKRGDVVTAVGNTKINNVAKLRYELFKYDSGDTVKLTINRNGKVNTINVLLGKLNKS